MTEQEAEAVALRRAIRDLTDQLHNAEQVNTELHNATSRWVPALHEARAALAETVRVTAPYQWGRAHHDPDLEAVHDTAHRALGLLSDVLEPVCETSDLLLSGVGS